MLDKKVRNKKILSWREYPTIVRSPRIKSFMRMDLLPPLQERIQNQNLQNSA